MRRRDQDSAARREFGRGVGEAARRPRRVARLYMARDAVLPGEGLGEHFLVQLAEVVVSNLPELVRQAVDHASALIATRYLCHLPPLIVLTAAAQRSRAAALGVEPVNSLLGGGGALSERLRLWRGGAWKAWDL